MKKEKILFITILCIVFISLFIFLLFFTSNANNKSLLTFVKTSELPTIIVDAGHGGEDGGAVGLDGTVEKNINLDIALKLEKLLKFYGFNVIMTRTDDIMVCDEYSKTIRQKKVSDIHNRFAIIENNPTALFVSVHQNKYSDSLQCGTQVFYSKNSESSHELAKCIQDSTVSFLQPNNKRVVKKTGTEIFLLYHAQTTAVLVECGFVSNYSDLKKLKTDDYKFQMAMVIADGIIKYISNR